MLEVSNCPTAFTHSQSIELVFMSLPNPYFLGVYRGGICLGGTELEFSEDKELASGCHILQRHDQRSVLIILKELRNIIKRQKRSQAW
jgi:hypothetical protein